MQLISQLEKVVFRHFLGVEGNIAVHLHDGMLGDLIEGAAEDAGGDEEDDAEGQRKDDAAVAPLVALKVFDSQRAF